MMEEGAQEPQIPPESFEDMVLRHREALGDIFETYNQFVMKESPSFAKRHSPR